MLNLLSHILRKGKLGHSGLDFSDDRQRVLESLGLPRGSRQTFGRKLTSGRPVLQALYGELAYINRSLRSQGGHLTLDAAGISYIRIPRAGSTSISRAMIIELLPELRTKNPNARHVNYVTDALLRRALLPQEKKNIFFTVVRDPFARIVSVYREFFERKRDDFIYEDYLFGVFKKSMTFGQFVETASMIPDWLKDQHLKPQVSFLRYYEQQGITVRTLKLEEKDLTTKFLLDRGLKFEPFNCSPDRYDAHNYYDARIAAKVKQMYSADIARFHYDPDLVKSAGYY